MLPAASTARREQFDHADQQRQQIHLAGVAAGLIALRDEYVRPPATAARAASSVCTWHMTTAPAAWLREPRLNSPNDSAMTGTFSSRAAPK
jgi:hypothetical protein